MKHRYLPMTDQDQADMLAAVGAETIDDLLPISPNGPLQRRPPHVKTAG